MGHKDLFKKAVKKANRCFDSEFRDFKVKLTNAHGEMKNKKLRNILESKGIKKMLRKWAMDTAQMWLKSEYDAYVYFQQARCAENYPDIVEQYKGRQVLNNVDEPNRHKKEIHDVIRKGTYPITNNLFRNIVAGFTNAVDWKIRRFMHGFFLIPNVAVPSILAGSMKEIRKESNRWKREAEKVPILKERVKGLPMPNFPLYLNFCKVFLKHLPKNPNLSHKDAAQILAQEDKINQSEIKRASDAFRKWMNENHFGINKEDLETAKEKLSKAQKALS